MDSQTVMSSQCILCRKIHAAQIIGKGDAPAGDLIQGITEPLQDYLQRFFMHLLFLGGGDTA